MYIVDLSFSSLSILYPTETCQREGTDINQIATVLYTQEYHLLCLSLQCFSVKNLNLVSLLQVASNGRKLLNLEGEFSVVNLGQGETF